MIINVLYASIFDNVPVICYTCYHLSTTRKLENDADTCGPFY